MTNDGLIPCPFVITPITLNSILLDDSVKNELSGEKISKKISIIRGLCYHPSRIIFDKIPVLLEPYKDVFSDSFSRFYFYLKQLNLDTSDMVWDPSSLVYASKLAEKPGERIILYRSFLYAVLCVLISTQHSVSIDEVFKLALAFDPLVMLVFRFLDAKKFRNHRFEDFEKTFNNFIPLYLNDNAFFDESGCLIVLSGSGTRISEGVIAKN
jgi:hypothetical protein